MLLVPLSAFMITHLFFFNFIGVEEYRMDNKDFIILTFYQLHFVFIYLHIIIFGLCVSFGGGMLVTYSFQVLDSPIAPYDSL